MHWTGEAMALENKLDCVVIAYATAQVHLPETDDIARYASALGEIDIDRHIRYLAACVPSVQLSEIAKDRRQGRDGRLSGPDAWIAYGALRHLAVGPDHATESYAFVHDIVGDCLMELNLSQQRN